MSKPNEYTDVVFKTKYGAAIYAGRYFDGKFHRVNQKGEIPSYSPDEINGWCYADAAFNAWSLQMARNHTLNDTFDENDLFHVDNNA